MIISGMNYDLLSNMILYVTNSVTLYLVYVYFFKINFFFFSLKSNFEYKCSVVYSFTSTFPIPLQEKPLFLLFWAKAAPT